MRPASWPWHAKVIAKRAKGAKESEDAARGVIRREGRGATTELARNSTELPPPFTEAGR